MAQDTEDKMKAAEELSGNPYGLSKTRIRALLVNLIGAYFFMGLLFSIPPAFYPSEAEAKGATPSQYGFVFGISHLAAFFVAPLVGMYGSLVGARLLLAIGMITLSFSGGIAFGLLDYVQDVGAFLGLSYTLRLLYGMSDAISYGCSLGMNMVLFPDKVFTLMSFLETCFGVGYSIGPAFGSFLYEVSDFGLPFYLGGALSLAFAVPLIFIMPNVKTYKKEEQHDDDASSNSERNRKLTLKSVLQFPSIWFPYVDHVLFQCSMGFLESMLEPHVKEEPVSASQAQVGYIFLVLGGVFTVVAPIVGHICDSVGHPTVISMVGNLMMALALVLLAPLLGDMKASLELTYAGAAVCGLAVGCVMVSTFARAHLATQRLGFRDDITTHIMTSSLWTGSFYLGNFLGPTIAGFIVEQRGFRVAAAFFFVLDLVLAASDIVAVALLGKKDAAVPSTNSAKEL